MERGTTRQPNVIKIRRPVYEISELNTVGCYACPSPKTCTEICYPKFCSWSCPAYLYQKIPILYWLPRYKWRQDIAGDVICGTTVAIMQIPQGIAYGILANLPPVVGIYMAIFPVLTYCLFGTSRHVSLGTFAIISLLTGKVVAEYSSTDALTLHNQTNVFQQPYTNIEVATAMSFAAGLTHLVMYTFRLGILTTLMSETLVESFTCAASFHVAIAQVQPILGLSLERKRDMFSNIETLYYVGKSILKSNIAAVTMSTGFLSILILNAIFFKRWLSEKTKVPFPIDLVAIAAATTISYLGNLHVQYGLPVVGIIPTGFPMPNLPPLSLVPSVAFDSAVIAIITYAVTVSMGLTFAHKWHYEVDSNQELFALGLSNLIGSFLSCMPVTGALARSMVQESTGGVTQLASVVSCLLLSVVLLYLGPAFETLPVCVLGCVILVALRTMLKKVVLAKQYWQSSKADFFVWIVTFITTTFVSIDIGLGVGVLACVLIIFFPGYRPYSCILGVVPNTDIYLDVSRYKTVQEPAGIKIFHYRGAINFTSKANFQTLLYDKVGLNPTTIMIHKQEARDSGMTSMPSSLEAQQPIKCIILDFAAVTHIDLSGVKVLTQIEEDYKSLNVRLYISSCFGPAFEALTIYDAERKDGKFKMFPTIHDAVLYAQAVLLHR